MAHINRLSFVAASLLVITCGARSAVAGAPADLCSLLPASEVGNVLGQAYGDPDKSVPLRPYKESGPGTDCDYSAKGSGDDLKFRIYADPSASVASTLFAKLKTFYSFAGKPTQVPGLGDDAYFDAKHGLHVLKGGYRFYLSLDTDNFTAANGQQLTTLATSVAGQL